VLCSLDAKVERPEQRHFDQNPMQIVRRERGRYVAAALTMLRGYFAAGMPAKPQPIGSFEAWSDWVRGTLLWLGMADPVTSMEAVRAADPAQQRLVAVFSQWELSFGNTPVTTRKIIDVATGPEAQDFREALLAVAGDRGAINTTRLGAWLRENKGRIINGIRLQTGRLRHGCGTWFLDGVTCQPGESRTCGGASA
jgi:hypothetical protein